MSGVEIGQNVQVHYVGTFDDGTEFDSSRSRGSTLNFKVGSGQTIKGFDQALIGMSVGETKNVSISPEDGYGPVIPEAVQKMPVNMFPQGSDLIVGATVVGTNALGQELVARIVEVNDEEVTLDMNHPMAGKTLNFEIELVSTE